VLSAAGLLFPAAAEARVVAAPGMAVYRASLNASRVTGNRTQARLSRTRRRPLRRQTVRRSGLRRGARGRARSARYRRRIPRGYFSPALAGSRESLLRQNEEIDAQNLPRIQDDDQLQDLIDQKELVPMEDTRYVRLAMREDRRWCRPAANDFINDLGKAYYTKFKRPIQVNSAVRTVEQQKELRRWNSNAAPETGETASSHLSGLTLDIAKRGMTRAQHKFVADYLARLKEEKVIEPEEERRQPVFHVMVYERYPEWRDERVTAEKKVNSEE